MQMHGWMITRDYDALLNKRSNARLGTATALKGGVFFVLFFLKKTDLHSGVCVMPRHLISDIHHLREWSEKKKGARIPSLLLRRVAWKTRLALASKLPRLFKRPPSQLYLHLRRLPRAHLSGATDNEHNSRII